jgi:hypothetical protein
LLISSGSVLGLLLCIIHCALPDPSFLEGPLKLSS